MLRHSEGTEYLSATSSDGGDGWSPAPSSVDSEELQELLEELQIVLPLDSQGGKRPLDSDSEAQSSPSNSRPHSSPRLDGSSWGGAAEGGAPGGAPRLPPPRQRQLAAPTGSGVAVQQQEVEVIDILDSGDDASDEEWRIAAPNTARKRLVVDSEEEDEDEGRESRASSHTAALPPFLAAIPGMAAAQPARPDPPRQQHPGAAAPHQQQQQDKPAGPPQQRSHPTASKAAGGRSRPGSANSFKRQRAELAAQLFQEFNRTVFGGQLPADLEIKWNVRLLTTAGLTHYRRDIPDDPYAPPIYTARVELSSKVLDCFSKLERTLCHELCHVAAWLVNHTAKPPHGPVFKAWADTAMRLYSHLDITTCHAYEIFYPYRWQCTNSSCLQEYGRHSNSIDVTKKVCGACRCPLTFLGRFKPDGTPAKPRSAATSKFIEFVKENHAEVRAQLPAGTPQKVVMQHLSAKYAEARQQRQQQQLNG